MTAYRIRAAQWRVDAVHRGKLSPSPMSDPDDLDRLVDELNASARERAHAPARLEEWLRVLRQHGGSDLYLVAGVPPSVRVHGAIRRLHEPVLDGDEIEAQVLPAMPPHAAASYRTHGHADASLRSGPGGRFRINLHRERGRAAASIRALPLRPPRLDELGLPPATEALTRLPHGLVLVGGPTGSGKTTTVAALVDLINRRDARHIVTIEDPIEFLHRHKKGTVHQRELHSDTPTFAAALRSALRQAPKVILVGEMRDRETIEIALTAAETGHLVLSSLHTIDASKTVDRIIGSFDLADQERIRARFATCFQYVISQRLLPRKEGGRMAIVEVLKSTMRTREYVEKGEKEGRSLLDAMRDGDIDGMQTFDGELEKLVRSSTISPTTAYLYATNPNNLRVALADVPDEDSLITR